MKWRTLSQHLMGSCRGLPCSSPLATVEIRANLRIDSRGSGHLRRQDYQGPLNGGVFKRGVPRSGLVLPFFSFFFLFFFSFFFFFFFFSFFFFFFFFFSFFSFFFLPCFPFFFSFFVLLGFFCPFLGLSQFFWDFPD